MFTTATAPLLYARLPHVRACNHDYLFWHPYWTMIRDVVMGEIMVKRKTTTYLPKLEAQDDDEYKAFLMRSVFFNMTARTVNALTGAVHMRDPLIANLPESVELLNVTRDGQSFTAFAKRITRETITTGRFGVLVDAPEGRGDPYFAGYVAEDITDWEMYRKNGRDRLRRVVLREYIDVAGDNDNLATKTEEYARVLLIDETGVYRQRVYPSGDPTSQDFKEITPLKNGAPMDYIPFWFIGPFDFGTDIEKPPILDIALLNLAHYQCYAQLQSGRFFTATPVWAVFLQGGGQDDLEFRVGGPAVWQLGSQDKAELIEFGGSGLSYLENALVMLEHQIVSLGGKLGAPTRGTAAESGDSVSLRERAEATFVHSMLTIMGDASTALLRELCAWRGIPAPDLTVKYAQDALDLYMTDREIRAIQSLWKTGIMPVEALYAIYRDANVLPADMSLDEFRESLPRMSPDTEQKVLFEREKGKVARKNMKAQPQPAAQPGEEEAGPNRLVRKGSGVKVTRKPIPAEAE